MKATVPIRLLPVGPAIHRFFDTSPFSPSGRYVGLTRMPTDARLPRPNEMAEVVVVDLSTDQVRTVDRTLAWDTQLGAQVQWGRNDNELIYNVQTDPSAGVHGRIFDITTGTKRNLAGEVYMVSATRGEAVSASLLHMGMKQPGYGVHWARPNDWRNGPDLTERGIRITPLDGGPSRLVLSIDDILQRFPALREGPGGSPGRYVCFHTKWNPQGTRLMTAFFAMAPDGVASRNAILTMAPDGSDVALALAPDTWALGGHHPNWCPNGEDILMNLKPIGKEMRLVRFRHDGAGFEILSEKLRGSGHPTMHPDGRHIITDAYPYEVGPKSTHVPLRWLDLQSDNETCLAEVPCVPDFVGDRQELRIDPHPAWDCQFRRVAINCLHAGTRHVAVVNLASVLR